MADKAHILIADISGFTDFSATTEIDHAAHIIAELLEVMIEAEDTGFTLAEIEGDALLMYRTGDPLSREELVDQCRRIFDAFHRQLMVIERDTVCRCSACQGSSALTLKFVAHYGFIKEIKVDRFTKAIGTEMIVAHRLMKNDVDSHEYVLITEACCEAMGEGDDASGQVWLKASQAYPSVGAVPFRCAMLSDFRATIPKPEPRPRFSVVKADDNLEIGIHSPVRNVYQTLINVVTHLLVMRQAGCGRPERRAHGCAQACPSQPRFTREQHGRSTSSERRGTKNPRSIPVRSRPCRTGHTRSEGAARPAIRSKRSSTTSRGYDRRRERPTKFPLCLASDMTARILVKRDIQPGVDPAQRGGVSAVTGPALRVVESRAQLTDA
jgi:class 3 adenylate cyclase